MFLGNMICKIVGHKWRYFTLLNSTDIRVCTRCRKVQRPYREPLNSEFKLVWSDLVQYTEQGWLKRIEELGRKNQ